MSKQLPTSYIVVTLLGLSVHGEFVPAETTLEVDRALRNDWIGSKLARDATDEEVAAYRVEQGDDGLDDLDEQRTALEAEIERLQDRKNELTAEVAALEEAKAAGAEPPATDAKAGKK